MDDVARSGCVFLSRAGVSSLLLACALSCSAAPPPLTGVGRGSDAPRAASGAAAAAESDGGPTPVESPIAADWKTRLARVGPDSFVAFGHAGGRYAATLYASPDAKGAIEAKTGDLGRLPVGTEVVMATVERATRKPGPTFYMQKQAEARPTPATSGVIADGGGAAWRFGVMESRRGDDASLCARCHAEAQRDFVFGVPE